MGIGEEQSQDVQEYSQKFPINLVASEGGTESNRTAPGHDKRNREGGQQCEGEQLAFFDAKSLSDPFRYLDCRGN